MVMKQSVPAASQYTECILERVIGQVIMVGGSTDTQLISRRMTLSGLCNVMVLTATSGMERCGKQVSRNDLSLETPVLFTARCRPESRRR